MLTQLSCPACSYALAYNGEYLFCMRGACPSTVSNDGVPLHTNVIPHPGDQRSATALALLTENIKEEGKCDAD
jgi:hypothetical protein